MQVPAAPIACGIHLMPVIGAIATPRPSCVVTVSQAGAVTDITLADTDEAIVAAIPDGVRVLAIDAPMQVANARGARAVDRLLQWLDVPVFPVSRARLETVFGGARGVRLADAVRTRANDVYETVPDLVLRELEWESSRPDGAPASELGEYRAAWLGLRPPRYRPKGTGRARPDGVLAALALVSTAIDPGGWVPDPDPDDWQAISDAAVVDAMVCAVTAWRAMTAPRGTMVVGDGPIPIAVPCDASLAERARINAARLGVPVGLPERSGSDRP